MSRPLTVSEFSNVAERGAGLLRWPSALTAKRVAFATSSFPPTVNEIMKQNQACSTERWASAGKAGHGGS